MMFLYLAGEEENVRGEEKGPIEVRALLLRRGGANPLGGCGCDCTRPVVRIDFRSFLRINLTILWRLPKHSARASNACK